jgi:hypothetical protein
VGGFVSPVALERHAWRIGTSSRPSSSIVSRDPKERKPMLRFVPVCAASLTFLLTACSVMSLVHPTPVFSPLSTLEAPQLPTRAVSPLSTPPATVLPRSMSALIELARADLARRLNVAITQIEVVSVVESEQPLQVSVCRPLGTLEPSIPAIVMGQEITLAAGGQTYTYWAQRGRLVLCTDHGADRSNSGK